MLSTEYKDLYETLFKAQLQFFQEGQLNESALPSYTHSNRMMSFFFWKRIEEALRIAHPLEGCQVLDFGAGGGILFKYLHEHACRITACEKEFLQVTRQVAKQLDVHVEVVEDLFTISGKTFDRIFALDVLEHIENIDTYLDKLMELCSPNGRIILSGPTENFLYKIGRWQAGFSNDYHVQTIFHIEEAFCRKGLKRVNLKRLYPIFTLFRVSMWIKP